MLVAVNPCGFALVPAYRSTYQRPAGPSRWRLLLRVIGFGAAVTGRVRPPVRSSRGLCVVWHRSRPMHRHPVPAADR